MENTTNKVIAIVLILFGFSMMFSRIHAQNKSSPLPRHSPYTSKKALPKPEIFAPGTISTGDDEAHVAFAENGKIIYFIKNSPDFKHWTIVRSKFEDAAWNTPEVVPFSGRYNDADVSFSSDGKTMFFISNRPTEKGGKPRTDTEIWKMRKTKNGWGAPQHIAILGSPGFEWFPMQTSDGTLYFGSERRKGNLGPAGTSDLYRSRLVNGQYTEPENLGRNVNTAGQDIEAYIAADGSFMIFASNAHEINYGSYDLYISYQVNGTWSEPKNLGKKINSEAWDFGPKVSPDKKYLFFTSNRGIFKDPLKQKLNYQELIQKIRGPKNGLRDIYQIDIAQIPLPTNQN